MFYIVSEEATAGQNIINVFLPIGSLLNPSFTMPSIDKAVADFVIPLEAGAETSIIQSMNLIV